MKIKDSLKIKYNLKEEEIAFCNSNGFDTEIVVRFSPSLVKELVHKSEYEKMIHCRYNDEICRRSSIKNKIAENNQQIIDSAKRYGISEDEVKDFLIDPTRTDSSEDNYTSRTICHTFHKMWLFKTIKEIVANCPAECTQVTLSDGHYEPSDKAIRFIKDAQKKGEIGHVSYLVMVIVTFPKDVDEDTLRRISDSFCCPGKPVVQYT